MNRPIGVTNQIDTIITTTMKLLEEKGYTDTDRWSEETFDQDCRPVIHAMIEKVYLLGKTDGRTEAVESLPVIKFLGRKAGENTVNGIYAKRKKEMLEPLSTPKQDD